MKILLTLLALLLLLSVSPVSCPYDGTTSYWTGNSQKTSGDPRDPGRCEYHHDSPKLSVPAHTFWAPCN